MDEKEIPWDVLRCPHCSAPVKSPYCTYCGQYLRPCGLLIGMKMESVQDIFLNLWDRPFIKIFGRKYAEKDILELIRSGDPSVTEQNIPYAHKVGR